MKYTIQVTKDILANDTVEVTTRASDNAAKNYLNTLKPGFDADDGYRLIRHRHEGNGATSVNGQAQVVYVQESASGINTYNTYQDAIDFIATLGSSDGYTLIDEHNGISTALDFKPSLWKEQPTSSIEEKENGHSRTDGDKI